MDYCRPNSSACFHSCLTALQTACWPSLQIWHPWVGSRTLSEGSAAWWGTTVDMKSLAHTISGMGTGKSAEYLFNLPCGQGSIPVQPEYHRWFILEHNYLLFRLLHWSSIIWFVKVFNQDHQNHWMSTHSHLSRILELPWVNQNILTITARTIKSPRLRLEEVKTLFQRIVPKEVLLILDTQLWHWKYHHCSAYRTWLQLWMHHLLVRIGHHTVLGWKLG